MRLALAVCAMIAVAFAAGEDNNPVESLDAGEIAAIDDGNFVDVFDDEGADPVNVQHDVDHMGSEDVSNALETWDALYGEDHPSKLGASNEPEAADSQDGENPKITAKKEQEAEITKSLLKSTSVEETNALEVKLGKVKDQIQELASADDTPEQAKAKLEKDIQKEVGRARAAKSEARKTLLAAKDSATSEQAQDKMKAAQKVIEKESEKLNKAQEEGDEKAAKQSSDIIKAKNKEIVEAGAETLISHEHQALVAHAERTMAKYLDKPKIFAKVSSSEPTLVEVKPAVPGANEAQAKEELKVADKKIVEAKVKEAAASTAADDTAAEVAKTAAPDDQVQLVAPLQKIAQEAAVNAKEKEDKAKEAAAYAKKMAEKSAEVAKKHAEKIKEKEAKKVAQVKKMALKAKENAKKIVKQAQTSAEKVVEKAEVMEEKAGNPKALKQEEKKEEQEKEDEAKQEIADAVDKKHEAQSKKLEAKDEKEEAQEDLKKAVTQGQIDRAKEVISEQRDAERDAEQEERDAKRKAQDAKIEKDRIEAKLAPEQTVVPAMLEKTIQKAAAAAVAAMPTPAVAPVSTPAGAAMPVQASMPTPGNMQIHVHIHNPQQPKATAAAAPVQQVVSKQNEQLAQKEAVAEEKAKSMKEFEAAKLKSIKTEAEAARKA